MTREEAIKLLKEDGQVNGSEEFMEAYFMAIKSLSQEPVLEQIRAEIEQSRYGLVNDGLDLALKIVDKYTSEEQTE